MSDFNRTDAIVSALSPELKEMASFIHANPELGHEEYKAYEAQLALLKKYGFVMYKGYCGYETAYKATYEGGKKGPTVAFLAEYDALPEIGHGCGHNLIAMVSVGAGIALREFTDKYGGRIYVIGTPAEETEGAKVRMAEEGVFDDVDVVMMAHPMNENADSFNSMALKSLKFKFYGKASHAATAPEAGINALDAVINMFNMVNALRQQIKPEARIHGVIKNGGQAPNTIPDYTEADFNIRANKCAYRDVLTRKVVDCAEGSALGAGCRMDVQPFDCDFKDTMGNQHLADLIRDNMKSIGLILRSSNSESAAGSSDLGDVSHVCPSIQCLFDITDGTGLQLHTVEFAECAGSDQAMERGIAFIKGLVLTSIELMRNPQHLREVKAEFVQVKKQAIECESGKDGQYAFRSK